MSNENVTTTTALIGLQGQLDNVRAEISATNAGLQNIATLIQTDSAFDQQRLLQEREQERLLAEREVRVDQSQELQQKVSVAVAQPVAKLEQKLTSTFNGITAALTGLFGFVGISVLSGLKTAADVSIKALTNIGGLIRNSFNAIGSGLASLRGGFGAVIGSITSVTNRISKAILSLAASPFKAIADIFKKFVPGVRPSGGGGSPAGGGINFLGLITAAGGAVSLAGNVKEGDVPGAVLSGASIPPSPIQFPAAIANLGYEAFGGKNIDMGKFFPKGMQMPSLPKVDFGAMGTAMGKAMGDIGTNVSNFFGVDLNAPPTEVKGNVEKGNTQASSTPKPSSVKTVPFTAPPSTQKPNLGNLPEPAPDIIYTTTGQQNQSAIVSGESQTLTDVPLIPSSNPDNFYTLYAQVNYNVVM